MARRDDKNAERRIERVLQWKGGSDMGMTTRSKALLVAAVLVAAVPVAALTLGWTKLFAPPVLTCRA